MQFNPKIFYKNKKKETVNNKMINIPHIYEIIYFYSLMK